MSNLDAQIKTFSGVARLGSFRRAADELCVTQAAVTSRIKGLEEYAARSRDLSSSAYPSRCPADRVRRGKTSLRQGNQKVRNIVPDPRYSLTFESLRALHTKCTFGFNRSVMPRAKQLVEGRRFISVVHLVILVMNLVKGVSRRDFKMPA